MPGSYPKTTFVMFSLYDCFSGSGSCSGYSEASFPTKLDLGQRVFTPTPNIPNPNRVMFCSCNMNILPNAFCIESFALPWRACGSHGAGRRPGHWRCHSYKEQAWYLTVDLRRQPRYFHHWNRVIRGLAVNRLIRGQGEGHLFKTTLANQNVSPTCWDLPPRRRGAGKIWLDRILTCSAWHPLG